MSAKYSIPTFFGPVLHVEIKKKFYLLCKYQWRVTYKCDAEDGINCEEL